MHNDNDRKAMDVDVAATWFQQLRQQNAELIQTHEQDQAKAKVPAQKKGAER